MGYPPTPLSIHHPVSLLDLPFRTSQILPFLSVLTKRLILTGPARSHCPTVKRVSEGHPGSHNPEVDVPFVLRGWEPYPLD